MYRSRSIVLLVALLAGGCVSTLDRAERLFDERSYEAAAAAYESALHGDASASRERALFHLALIYSQSESPLHDAERARELFTEIADETPAGPYGAQAELILGLERRRHELRGAAERTRREIEALKAEAARFKQESKAREEATAALNAELEDLRRRATDCEAQLEKLKAIDLGKSP